jgi:hypothetical protein
MDYLSQESPYPGLITLVPLSITDKLPFDRHLEDAQLNIVFPSRIRESVRLCHGDTRRRRDPVAEPSVKVIRISWKIPPGYLSWWGDLSSSMKPWARSAGVFTPGSSNKVAQFTVEILDQRSPLYVHVFFTCFLFYLFLSSCALFLLNPFLLSFLRFLSQNDLCVSTRR